MPVVVTGKTWDIRDRLKSLGGRWNADTKSWKFYTLSPQHRAEFNARVGVMIVDKPGDPAPKPQRPSLAELVSSWDKSETDGGYQTIIRGDDPTYFNYFADRNPQVYFGFSSLVAMQRYLEHIKPEKQNGSGWDIGRESFCGTDCMEQAFRLAINGWPEGVELAETITQTLLGSNAIERRRKHSISGGFVNVGRMLAGNPSHMISRPKQDGRKVITLFISVTMMAFITAENSIVRAAVIAAISDILEMNGYSCEIIAVDTYHHRSKPIGQIAVKLKEAGETLDINETIFAMGHPSFLRRFCFALIGSEETLRKIWDDMGSDGIVFDDDIKPKSNELYIDHLIIQMQNEIDDFTIMEKAFALLRLCTDEKFPVKLNREDIET